MSRQLSAADGTPLHLAELGPEDADRTLVIVHGYGEHGGRYVERAKTFADAGFRVLVPDVRGHGRSGGERGHVMEFGTYLDDLAVVVHEAGDTELFVLGHSHGGLIVASWLLDRAPSVTRAVMTSPFFGLGLDPAPWKVIAGKLLSRLTPKVSLPTEIDAKFVSHDPDVVAAYEADPLNHTVANVRWFTEVAEAQQRALANASRLRVPVLLMQAGDDQLVTPVASERWADAAPDGLVRFELVDGAYHELLFEVDGQTHADRILRWLQTES